MRHIHIRTVILSVIALTAMMAECERGNVPLLQTTRHAPVKAEINGVLFSSEEYTYLGWGGNDIWLSTYESKFSFGFGRDLISNNDESSIDLSLSTIQNTPFELNKKYNIGTDVRSGCGQISFTHNGIFYKFVSTEGYIVFTKCIDQSTRCIVSGYFEFTATDSEKGITINVTNGTFEDLYT